ncbi:MAG: Lrp/AsnC family transcriptional regulator [Spirochaetota bacterium]|nr:Lrp/AsnC family transcriptional regulator [Spirochaetota bacterium]
MKPYKVDEVGEDILSILSKNAKLTAADIAKQLNIPEETVRRRIKKYEKDKIIFRYKTLVNWERIKEHEVRALIEVKVVPERGVGFDTVAESIYRFSEVSSVYLLSGSYDLLVHVEGPTLKEVALFVSEKLATLSNVQSTVTHFLLKKYKEDGDILVDQADLKRLPLSF